MLLDAGDSLGPGALAGVVGVGEACGVLALRFGEVLEKVVEALLECWAGHGFDFIWRGKRSNGLDSGILRGVVLLPPQQANLEIRQSAAGDSHAHHDGLYFAR